MSMMISPRSQENQYHYQQQQQQQQQQPSTQGLNTTNQVPSNGINQSQHPQLSLPNTNQTNNNPTGPIGNYPLYSTIPQFPANNNNNNNANGAGYNLNFHNNYTTTANQLPPSNNSSFSLPSVPHAIYYEQVPSQQHEINTNNGNGAPVYYYQQQYLQPNTNQNGNSYEFSGCPQFGFHEQQVQQQQQQQVQMMPSQQIPTHGSIPHTNMTQPALSQLTNEEVPFPGVLDPSTYHRHTSSNTGPTSTTTYHPRSATYPIDHSKAGSSLKQARQSLGSTGSAGSISSNSSSSNLLGMTPETARRNRCTICQKQFKRPSSLQTHLYSHTGEKPFACTWENCGRLFSVRSNMIRHRKLHERDASLKNGGSGSIDGDIKEEDEGGEQQDNGTGPGNFGQSLPNLLHPSNNQNGSNGEFQLGYFN